MAVLPNGGACQLQLAGVLCVMAHSSGIRASYYKHFRRGAPSEHLGDGSSRVHERDEENNAPSRPHWSAGSPGNC